MVGSRLATDVHKAADLTRAPTTGNVECSAYSRIQIVFYTYKTDYTKQ